MINQSSCREGKVGVGKVIVKAASAEGFRISLYWMPRIGELGQSALVRFRPSARELLSLIYFIE